MARRVLIHGATGETGTEIVDGLLEHSDFELAALVRPQSLQKPATESLISRGVEILVGDLATQSIMQIAQLLVGFDTIISAVAATAQLDQIKLVDAAAEAEIKRFVPCGFTSVSPPGGVMSLVRDEKEKVYQRIWYHHLPYTIIDSGTWFQIAFPSLPSGRADYAFVGESNTVFCDGNAPNLMINKKDIGRLTARIIGDSRTINRSVFMHSEVLNQNDIWAVVESKSGEKIEARTAIEGEIIAKMHAAREAHRGNPSDPRLRFAAISAEYAVSKYVRQDNTPNNAKYLGYLDTRDLYPDFKPSTFSAFIDELLAGKTKRVYQDRFEFLSKKDS